MLDLIANKIAPEMLLGIFIIGSGILLLSVWRPFICLALSFPIYFFLVLLKSYFPVSISAATAVFTILAGLGYLISGRGWGGLGKIDAAMILLAALMIFSVTYTSNPEYGQEKTILFCFTALPLVLISKRTINDFRSLNSVLFIISFSLFAYVVISILMGGEGAGEGDRDSAILDVTRAGQVLGLCCLAAVIYLRSQFGGVLLRCVVATAGLISFVLLLKTGTRGALLSLFISILFVFWFLHTNFIGWILAQIPKILIFFTVAFVFIAAVSPLLKSVISDETLDRFTTVEGFLEQFSDDDLNNWEDSKGRTVGFMSALKGIAAKPLWGYGAGGYREALTEFSSFVILGDESGPVYPHNLFLEFGVEQGLLGLILVLYITALNFNFIKSLRPFLGRFRSQEWALSYSFGIYVYGFLVALTSLDIPRMMILWWGIALVNAVEKNLCRDMSRRI